MTQHLRFFPSRRMAIYVGKMFLVRSFAILIALVLVLTWYATFQLAREEYGVPVLKVREIIKMLDITNVPQVPQHVKGVINLRGTVIPVIDVRVRLQNRGTADAVVAAYGNITIDTDGAVAGVWSKGNITYQSLNGATVTAPWTARNWSGCRNRICARISTASPSSPACIRRRNCASWRRFNRKATSWR